MKKIDFKCQIVVKQSVLFDVTIFVESLKTGHSKCTVA